MVNVDEEIDMEDAEASITTEANLKVRIVTKGVYIWVQVPHVYFIHLLSQKRVTVIFCVNLDRLCLRANHQTQINHNIINRTIVHSICID